MKQFTFVLRELNNILKAFDSRENNFMEHKIRHNTGKGNTRVTLKILPRVAGASVRKSTDETITSATKYIF